MRPPYYWCAKCNYGLQETRYPIDIRRAYPICPKCGDNASVDVVMGRDTDRPTDIGLSEDTVIATY